GLAVEVTEVEVGRLRAAPQAADGALRERLRGLRLLLLDQVGIDYGLGRLDLLVQLVPAGERDRQVRRREVSGLEVPDLGPLGQRVLVAAHGGLELARQVIDDADEPGEAADPAPGG